MPDTYRPPVGAPEPVDLLLAAEVVLTARQDTSDGLVARELLVPLVADMITEIGLLRDTVTAYSEDLEDMRTEIELARSLRLEWSAIRAALNAEVQTPARTIAYLEARGWVKESDRYGGAVWQNADLERSAFVPMLTHFVDWDKRMSELVHDLADAYGTGELGVLADIAEASDV
jgi:hypothetical protein